jgi:signal peptidase I
MDDINRFVTLQAHKPISASSLETLMGAVLERGKSFRFQAKGWSMAPFILDGDLIRVAPLSSAKLKPGHIVAYLNPGNSQLVVHRIVSVQPNAYLIRGDNQSDQDCQLISPENILGCVMQIERAGRNIRLGLGPESALIAKLSRKGLLQPYLARLKPFMRPLHKVLP